MATENVTIIVSEKGAVTVKKNIEDIGTASTKASKGADLLKGTLATLFTAASVALLAKYGDSATNIANKLRLVTSSTQELTSAQEALYQISQSTFTSFEGNVGIFTRAKTALKDLGLSTQDTLTFTERLAKATALSGSTASQASDGLTQFAQGLARGTLQGDELGSVLENLPYLAQKLAQGLNVPIGSLKQLGAEGKITAKDIVAAFDRVSGSIDADFSKITPTIGQGLETINNGFIKLAGVLESNIGIFGLVGTALVYIGHNLDSLAIAITPVISLIGALAVAKVAGWALEGAAAIGSLLTSFITFGTYLVTTAIPAVISFGLAVITNPFTIWVIGIGALLLVLYQLTDYFLKGNAEWEAWKQSGTDAIDSITSKFTGAGLKALFTGGKATIAIDGKSAATDIANAHKQGAAQIEKAIDNTANNAARAFQNTLDAGAVGMSAAIQKANDYGAQKQGTAIKESSSSGALVMRGNIESGGSVVGITLKGSLVDGGKSLSEIVGKAFSDAWNGLLDAGRSVAAFIKAALGFGGGDKSASKPAAKAATGNEWMVGGRGGTDSQVVKFRATPNERVLVETPKQQRDRDNAQAPASASPVIQQNINNIFDANQIVDMMDTSRGQSVQLNFVRAKREEILAILGVAT